MIVTKIETVTRTKYKVEIDQEFAFVLYKGELSQYEIREGEKISEEVYQKIRKEVVLRRAKLRALHLLTDVARTEAGLRQKLKQNLYSEDIVELVIQYVQSFGYLDDLRYAESFVLNKKQSKSRKEIYALLCEKGVSRDLIDLAMENCYEDGEQEAIRQLIRKKNVNLECTTEKELNKLYAYLARKGFRYEDIRQVIQKSV
ncbi:MAG: regulatory protein RecX [Schaedlerella sp.]|nr:regulatory protein RecX [Schaedlerella sp.]